MDHTTGRRTWRTLEPYHAAIYLLPHGAEVYAEIGVSDQWAGYFASRAAPMGAVNAEVVIATFFNFDHDMVRRAMAGVWEHASPAQFLEGRLTAVDRYLSEYVLDAVDADNMARAAELARVAADEACTRPEGRPLFAGHASLEYPDDVHLALWHSQTLLREYRGDGHIAALVEAGLDGCEALVLHGASGEVSPKVLKATRQRTDDDWAAAVERLKERGWLAPSGTLSDAGREGRQVIEDATDRMAFAPYAELGEARCAELRQLTRPWSAVLAEAFGR